MLGVRKADSLLAAFLPGDVETRIFFASGQRQVKWVGHASGPISEGLEAGTVVIPLFLDAGQRGEQFPLFAQGRLLVVGAV